MRLKVLIGKKIVVRLKEMDLLNDLVYGESYVRTQMRIGDRAHEFCSKS